jgi:hypothetical protein
MIYGYDGEHLFSYDGEFKYIGETDEPPDGVSAVEDKMAARMTGGYFLSGNRRPALSVWSDGEGAVTCVSYVKEGQVRHANVDLKMAHHVPICLSGPVVYDGEKLAEFCRTYPHSSVFACPVVQELAAFGAACQGVPTYRAFLADPVIEEYDGIDSQEYDPKLEGDGLGRMASVVSKNGFAVNQMRRPVGVSVFYGRTLFRDPHPERPGLFIVQADSMVKYFPAEPVSLKSYAATSVPVVVSVTDKFREATGYEGEKAAVVAATDHVRGLPVFMRFYQLMSGGRDWVCFSDKYAVNGFKQCQRVPVFRYNKAYMVPIDEYLKDCE